MSPAECIKLVDAAMKSHAPASFLAGIQHASQLGGRDSDALTAAVLKDLFRTGEIEIVMHMRAECWGKRSRAHLSPGAST